MSHFSSSLKKYSTVLNVLMGWSKGSLTGEPKYPPALHKRLTDTSHKSSDAFPGSGQLIVSNRENCSMCVITARSHLLLVKYWSFTRAPRVSSRCIRYTFWRQAETYNGSMYLKSKAIPVSDGLNNPIRGVEFGVGEHYTQDFHPGDVLFATKNHQHLVVYVL